jgi:hypothetical protein
MEGDNKWQEKGGIHLLVIQIRNESRLACMVHLDCTKFS